MQAGEAQGNLNEWEGEWRWGGGGDGDRGGRGWGWGWGEPTPSSRRRQTWAGQLALEWHGAGAEPFRLSFLPESHFCARHLAQWGVHGAPSSAAAPQSCPPPPPQTHPARTQLLLQPQLFPPSPFFLLACSIRVPALHSSSTRRPLAHLSSPSLPISSPRLSF